MAEAAQAAFTVRDALESELGAVRELTLAAYREYAQIMEPTSWEGLSYAVGAAMETPLAAHRIVAVSRGEIIGSVMLFPAAADAYRGATELVPWPELRLLAVAPLARGMGVGQRLVEEVVRRARVSGAPALGLHTSRSMQAGIRMYERLGFVRDPAHDFHGEGNEVVLAYRLALT